MVSVRSTVLPVHSEDNRPLRSTGSNGALSSRNSVAHTPTVNAGSSLAVADTILLFLSTLRPYPEIGDENSTRTLRGNGNSEGHQRNTLLLSSSDWVSPPDSNEAVWVDDRDIENVYDLLSRSTSKAGTRQGQRPDHLVTSLLFELSINPANEPDAQSLPDSRNTTDENFPESASATARRFVSENFMMSQASIALMFGLSIDEKAIQDTKTGPAQNDNRASARYRQQSPDSWGNPANSNIWFYAKSDGVNGSSRPQILRATFTEAGTYQFG